LSRYLHFWQFAEITKANGGQKDGRENTVRMVKRNVAQSCCYLIFHVFHPFFLVFGPRKKENVLYRVFFIIYHIVTYILLLFFPKQLQMHLQTA